jgi:hypothetical protein
MKLARIFFLCCLLSVLFCGKAFAFDVVRIGYFNLIYGKAGGSPILDFVPRWMLNPNYIDWYRDNLTVTREFDADEKQAFELGVEF